VDTVHSVVIELKIKQVGGKHYVGKNGAVHQTQRTTVCYPPNSLWHFLNQSFWLLNVGGIYTCVHTHILLSVSSSHSQQVAPLTLLLLLAT